MRCVIISLSKQRGLLIMEDLTMKVEAYIHSLKDRKTDRNVLGEAEIIKAIGDNLYLAEYNGVRCTAIFNPFVSRYFVDDLYGRISED